MVPEPAGSGPSIYAALAEDQRLNESDREERISARDRRSKWENHIQWVRRDCVERGWISNDVVGVWKLTDAGRTEVLSHEVSDWQEHALSKEALRALDDGKKPSESFEAFTESRRLATERYFFARNQRLIEVARKHHGGRCQVCGFDFHERYGERGKGYIEVHHLDPLSERDEAQWTSVLKTDVNGVAVLCANCHRMVHRTRPALTLDELKQCLGPAGRR